MPDTLLHFEVDVVNNIHVSPAFAELTFSVARKQTSQFYWSE